MKALIYLGVEKKNLEDRPMPTIAFPMDAIVKVTKTTICGTDLHILKGGWILGNTIDGTQTEYVRIPFADTSLYQIPMWSQNIAITTRLVDTFVTPMLLKTVQAKKINPNLLISHHFKLENILDAYATFGQAAKTKALKVIIDI